MTIPPNLISAYPRGTQPISTRRGQVDGTKVEEQVDTEQFAPILSKNRQDDMNLAAVATPTRPLLLCPTTKLTKILLEDSRTRWRRAAPAMATTATQGPFAAVLLQELCTRCCVLCREGCDPAVSPGTTRCIVHTACARLASLWTPSAAKSHHHLGPQATPAPFAPIDPLKAT